MRTLIAVIGLLALPAVVSAQDFHKRAPGESIPPDEAAKKMTLPEGFSATAFAGEPAVRQPNAMCIDDRGRVWVAENFSYTGPRGPWKPTGKDTILIFEDTDGDGKHDKRTVFYDKLGFVSGLEVGFGGVWVGQPPHLLFIPDKDGDDVPDGEPKVVLDGWGHHDQHETMNSFMWGPDGWLYGCQGIFTHSKVGKPGTPARKRVPLNAAYWRYHPTKETFEVFAWGTSNPWGMDFDDHGQLFSEACVIPHLWHIVQGGRYHRQSGKHFNPHIYADIKTIADHKHVGIKGRKGGHAHGGARFILNDVFPKELRGKFLMGTIHHHGMYTDTLVRKGSGFTGKHHDDFMMSNDLFYLGFNHDFGPDGSLYVIDWYDPRACHGQTPEHKETGRVYRIAYKGTQKVDVDLAKKSNAELVELQLSRNEWYVRHARRILQERGPNPEVHAGLMKILDSNPEIPRKLRALWTLHCTGGAGDDLLVKLLGHENEYLRSWAIQLLAEDGEVPPGALTQWVEMAKSDPSPVVRLYLSSAMQRVPLEQRWGVLEALVAHEVDRDDHNLPLMHWYATEPLVMADKTRALKLAAKTKVKFVREFIARRLAAGSSEAPRKRKGARAKPADSVSDTGLALWLKAGAGVEGPEGRLAAWKDQSKQACTLKPSKEGSRPEAGEKAKGREVIWFDGQDDHVTLPHCPSVTFGEDRSFTLSAWVFVENPQGSGWRGVVTKSRDAAPWYGLWIDGSNRWVFGGTGNIQGEPVAKGWQHVCAVQEAGKGRKLYVDGHLSAEGKSGSANGTGDLWIGGAKSVDEFFGGAIGEVRIYSRALNAAEVSRLAER